jgi:CHAT domain-containing protein
VIDIYRLRLNTALVTLSACETGVGQLRGDDLFGLVRGCLHAGAPSLVVSLWHVDDASTTLLMSDFYKRLTSGESIANALREAQQALRQVERVVQGKRIRPYEHPYYWAPFFLIGADGRV